MFLALIVNAVLYSTSSFSLCSYFRLPIRFDLLGFFLESVSIVSIFPSPNVLSFSFFRTGLT